MGRTNRFRSFEFRRPVRTEQVIHVEPIARADEAVGVDELAPLEELAPMIRQKQATPMRLFASGVPSRNRFSCCLGVSRSSPASRGNTRSDSCGFPVSRWK